MPTVDPARQRLGSALVVLQLLLIAAMAALAAPVFLGGRAPLGAWILGAAGLSLGVWALSCNRPGNFNIRPTPRSGGSLVQHGPYRWVRHPMYTAVIACGIAAAWASATALGWVGAAALTAVLAVKAMLEERWMLVEHPEYAAYRARTSRFLPGVF